MSAETALGVLRPVLEQKHAGQRPAHPFLAVRRAFGRLRDQAALLQHALGPRCNCARTAARPPWRARGSPHGSAWFPRPPGSTLLQTTPQEIQLYTGVGRQPKAGSAALPLPYFSLV